MSKQKNADPADVPQSAKCENDTEAVDGDSQSSTLADNGKTTTSSEAEPTDAPVEGGQSEDLEKVSLEPTEVEQLKTEVDGLTEKLINLESQLNEAQRDVAYAKAETQTVMRRGREDATRAVNRAKRDLLTRLMLVADTFHRTSSELEKIEKDERTDVIVTAVQVAIKEFDKVLSGEGLELSNPVGEAFDPQFHEAQATVPSESAEAGTILEVLRVGYLLDGSVLRAPQVVVAAEVQKERDEASDDV